MDSLTGDALRDGRDAQRLLNDVIFKFAIAEADANFVREWRSASTTEDRERAWAKQAALDAVVQQIEIVVGRGQHAAARG